MKKIKSFLTLIFIFSCTFLIYTSCGKESNDTDLYENKSRSIPEDPISRISIDKNGYATIESKSGQKIFKPNFLIKSKAEAFSSKLRTEEDNVKDSTLVVQTIRVPVNIEMQKKSSLLNETSSYSSLSSSEDYSDGDQDATEGYFTFTLTRRNGYVTISVWPAVMSIDDYVVRATPFVTRHYNPVLWEINYVYTRNGASFYSTQVEMSTYL